MKRRANQIAVLIPLVGLMLLIVRAETAVRTGPTFQVKIGGYDPRDLLHGHFLRYRYVFNWQGPHTCGGSNDTGSSALQDGCCICLTHTGPDGFDPPARQVQCEQIEPGMCDGVLKSNSVKPPQKYFIPEEQARDIERATRAGEPALELTCGLDQTPAIRELLINGLPWYDVVGVEEPAN